MGSEYYGINRNDVLAQMPDAVTVGTSTGSTDIEVRLDLTKGMTSLEIENALEVIFRRIIDGRYGEMVNV
jgi:hypothetical protein